MKLMLKAVMTALSAKAAELIFRQVRDETVPRIVERSLEGVRRKAWELSIKGGLFALAFAGFLMLFSEVMRQIDEQGILIANAKFVGSASLLFLAAGLAWIPWPKHAKIESTKDKNEQLDSYMMIGAAGFEKPVSLPPLEPERQSGLDVILQELRMEREHFMTQWKLRQ